VKLLPTIALLSSLGVVTSAQQTAKPELKLRISSDKENYSLKEKVLVKPELINLTTQTLCFPVPDQECSTTGTGWVTITGKPVDGDEGEVFICHVDSRSASGDELDSNIRNRWIKLAPNAIYTGNPTEAGVTLSVAGDWKLTAHYHPPEGSFDPKYRDTLQSAAKKAGCTLPVKDAEAEPKVIHVHPSDTNL
jgi:hypothetical protein